MGPSIHRACGPVPSTCLRMKHEAFLTGAFPLTYNYTVLKQIGILAWEEDRC